MSRLLNDALIEELKAKIGELQEASAFAEQFDMRKLALAKTNLEQGLLWLEAAKK